MDTVTSELIKQVVPALATIIGLLLTWATGELIRYLRARIAKTNNKTADKALDIIDGVISKVVASYNQTIVEKIKAAAADGKLTEEEANEIKASAQKIVMDQISPTIQKTAALAVSSVEEYVNHGIENSIAWNKG